MNDLTVSYADVNGTRLCYEIAGTGPPLVFIHGFSLDRRMWDAQFAFFAQRFRTLRYDVRGFGRSALPETDQAYRDSTDLHALMTHLGIDQAHLVGLSMGGSIATDFALEYPGNTSALVTVDASASGWSWPYGFPLVAAIERSHEAGIAAGKQTWLTHPLFAPANEQPEVAAQLKTIVDEYSGWHFENESLLTPLDPPAMQRFAEIAAPTLIILGERDQPDFFEIADLMSTQTGAKQHHIPGVGHMSNMEAPTEFNRTLLEFLEQLPAPKKGGGGHR